VFDLSDIVLEIIVSCLIGWIICFDEWLEDVLVMYGFIFKMLDSEFEEF